MRTRAVCRDRRCHWCHDDLPSVLADKLKVAFLVLSKEDITYRGRDSLGGRAPTVVRGTNTHGHAAQPGDAAERYGEGSGDAA